MFVRIHNQEKRKLGAKRETMEYIYHLSIHEHQHLIFDKKVSFWIILETLSFVHFAESIKLLPIIVILIVSLNFLCKKSLSKAFIHYDLSQEDI